MLGLGLVAAPATVSADAARRFSEHAVLLFCDAQGALGELHLFVGVSSEFGPSADLQARLAPVDPTAPPDFSGFTTDVAVVEAGGGATLSTAIPLVDAEGNAVGDAVVQATLTPTGEVIQLEPFREGNRWIKTTGTVAVMTVTGTLDAPGDLPDFALEDLGCAGQIIDVQVFETQPHAFVFANEGTFIFCEWERDGTFAHLFAVNDVFGTFADTSLFIEGEHDIFGFAEGADVSIDATSLVVTIPWSDFLTGETGTATASATLTPLGEPVTSTIVGQNLRQRLTEQALTPDGSLSFSTGDEFTLDAAACISSSFDIHGVETGPSGPKPGGSTPVNDTPEGALPLRIGGTVNDQTGGAASDAEIQIVGGCPEPDDAFGHTLWYTFTGTGGPVTIDTAGSNFDTVLAVYDDQLNQIACNDDVLFEPIGGSFQAALTLETTVEGATYYVQAGGFIDFFTGVPEFGRLRLSIS
jgi:hypothetical protein